MYGPEVTPNDVIRETGRWVPAAIIVALAVLLVGGIITVICWSAGWWFASHDVNRQNQLYQNSYGVQQADIGAMQNAIGAIASAADGAQANADAQEACGYAAKITIMPPADKGWVSTNCLAGAVAPGSQYAK
jgi:hypothetical protein